MMAMIMARSNPMAAEATKQSALARPAPGDAFAAAVGRLVRLGRAKRGMTRRQLAQESGTSERYLAQIESGQGNPSVIILKSIAEALDVPIIELLPRTNGRSAVLNRILDGLGRLPPSELPAIAEMIEDRAAADVATDRARRIALVGLRGAGKSTLGAHARRSSSAVPSSSSTAWSSRITARAFPT